MAASLFTYLGIGAGWYLLIVIVVLAGLFVLAMVLQYRKVGPNEVLIISGGKRQTLTEPDGTVRTVGYRTHIGGGTFVLPLVEKAQVLPIEMITVSIETPEVYTAKGVPLMVEATAQIKVSTDEHSLRKAAEQFLSMGPNGIMRIAREMIDGCVRSTLGTMGVEEIYRDQKGFAYQVIETLAPEFQKMGLVLVSFALSSIKDTQGFLESLGKPRIAQVKRDAAIAEAEADKESAMKAAGAKKEAEIARLQGETEIAEAGRDFETQKAQYEAAINEQRATADMAYDLQRHRQNQELKKEEYKVKIVEKEQAAIMEAKEIVRVEKELEANVKKPADAKKYEAMLHAESEAYRVQKEAEAKAEADKLDGAVRSQLIKQLGAAEAESMKQKAESWQKYTQAAMFEMLMAKLPELAQAIAQPLSKVDRITVVNSGGEDSSLGVSKVTGEVAKILAQMPEVIESLSGVDVKKWLSNLPQGEEGKKEESQEKEEKKGKAGTGEGGAKSRRRK